MEIEYVNEKNQINDLDLKDKLYILERAFRKKTESHEATKVFVEENFLSDEDANDKLLELLKEGDLLVGARIRYAVAFKKLPPLKFIDEYLVEETKEYFGLSTHVAQQLEQEENLKKLINDKNYRDDIKEFMMEYVFNENEDISEEYAEIYVNAHLVYLIYCMLFEETQDLYELYAQYVKPKPPRFAVVLQDNEYVFLEVARSMLSVKAGKTVNNTQLFSELLNYYISKLSKDEMFKNIFGIVQDKIEKEGFNK